MACSSTFLFKGEASWFCCGNAWGPCSSTGTGACGNCQSVKHMAAWPNLSSACDGVTDPGACGLSPPLRGCGSKIRVHCRCSQTNVCVKLADCGPNTQLFCGEQTCCGSDCQQNRVIDLTSSAFSVIGSLSSGLLPVHLYE
jgi:hypothetical protein